MTEEPCDIMVCDAMARTLLPGMRAEMVYRLVRGQGMSQSEIARRLGISRAAVSQYMSRKRGHSDLPLSQEMDEVIDLWAQAVMHEEVTITLCDICRCAMKKKP
jgi:predicted transcriptional regulator